MSFVILIIIESAPTYNFPMGTNLNIMFNPVETLAQKYTQHTLRYHFFDLEVCHCMQSLSIQSKMFVI